MTYDRMKAKRIAGENCRFCGDESSPLVKMRCCKQWICSDTAFVSIRGGGYCQFQHEYYSICHFHYNEGHLPGQHRSRRDVARSLQRKPLWHPKGIRLPQRGERALSKLHPGQPRSALLPLACHPI